MIISVHIIFNQIKDIVFQVILLKLVKEHINIMLIYLIDLNVVKVVYFILILKIERYV